MRFALIWVWLVVWAVPAWSVESICPGGSSPRADVLFCEDWEAYNPVTNASFPDTEGSTFNGWTARAEGRPDGHGYIQSSIKNSGTYALRQQRQAPGDFVPAIEKAISGSPTGIRLRFYLYMASPFGGLGVYGEPSIHVIFFNTDAASQGHRVDMAPYINKTGTADPPYIYAWPPTCGNTSNPWEAYLIANSPQGAHGSPFKGVTQGDATKCRNLKSHFDAWHLWEIAWDLSAGTVSIWFDGTLIANAEPITTDPANATFTSMILSGYCSTDGTGVDAPCGQGGLGGDANLYFDDIVLGNDPSQSIGSSGAPPQNVIASTLMSVRHMRGVQQCLESVSGVAQLLLAMWLWERRSAAVVIAMRWWRYAVALESPKTMWWVYRYKRAVTRWQRAAPVMLVDHRRQTIDLPASAWSVRHD